jgi:hypothetical protein
MEASKVQLLDSQSVATKAETYFAYLEKMKGESLAL